MKLLALLLLLPLPAAAAELSIPEGLEFREPFLIGNMRAGKQSQALNSSRGSCRAVLLSSAPEAGLESGARFEHARVEGVYHKVLVAERLAPSGGAQQLQVECMVRLRDKTPLSHNEFLALLRELGFLVRQSNS